MRFHFLRFGLIGPRYYNYPDKRNNIVSFFIFSLTRATSIRWIKEKRREKNAVLQTRNEFFFARNVQLGPRVSGYGRTTRATVTRWNSEGAEKRAKNSGQKRRGGGGEGRGTRRGISLEKGRVGGMEGDRSTGPLDRRTERQTGDWRPLITGGACARNAAALVSSIQ